jgi:hypothetical protein
MIYVTANQRKKKEIDRKAGYKSKCMIPKKQNSPQPEQITNLNPSHH